MTASVSSRLTESQILHILPAGVEPHPVELTIVVPALNEQVTIGEFVDWCKEGLGKIGVEGQILIVDSSTDQTPQVALAHGAEILKVPRRGLGRAYIDAMPYVRGKYILMGDADLTYDLREIKPFIEKLKEGFEFVMGSRLLGYVEPGAMPRLHQYFGTPVTTWILNLMYGTHFSDIHCGMRAMTLDALKRINLEAQSWEYASEMVLKSAKLNLSATEVPIRFYKDRKGRVSHHRRSGWFSPWRAGWLNLKLMFIYAPDFFLWKPGWFLFVLGLLLTISLARGPYSLAGIGLNLHWMLLGLTLATLGYSAIQLAILSRVFYNFNPLFTEKMCRLITYNRGIWMGITLDLIGVSLNLVLLIHWISSGLRLVEFYHPGIFGLLLISLGFQTFTFTLLFQMIVRSLRGCAK